MRSNVLALVAALSTTSALAADRPRGPFVGVLFGVGTSGCEVVPEYGRCVVHNYLFRADGASLGLEGGLALDHGLSVALEAEFLPDYDLLGTQSRFGAILRYAPVPWIWVGSGPVIATETATQDLASRSDLGIQIGGGFDARWVLPAHD